MSEIEMVDVLAVRALEGATLWVRFSDGREGQADLSTVLARGGPMVEPLREPAYFRRVFVEMGAPTWPNGFDLDPIALHRSLAEAGRLRGGRAA